MKRVIYRSHALVGEYTPGALSILATAERRNRQDGITGYLHRETDRFLQVIEGPAAAVDALMIRLQEDPRHTGLAILSEHVIANRSFADWDMGYVSNHNLRIVDVLPEIWTSERLPNRSVELVLMFFQDLAELKARAA